MLMEKKNKVQFVIQSLWMQTNKLAKEDRTFCQLQTLWTSDIEVLFGGYQVRQGK